MSAGDRAHSDGPAPIGVFDSGVGGISLLARMQAQLPYEQFVYFADSLHAPWGGRNVRWIAERSLRIAEALISRGAKALVVACNTATSAAVVSLRARFRVPIIAVEPAVKVALTLTRARAIGVLATERTLGSESFARLLRSHGRQARVLAQPCPGLADRVEAGDLDSAATRALVDSFVYPLVEQGIDVLVLGCTHYPFLRAAIEHSTGPEIQIVDPSAAIARHLQTRLHEQGMLQAEPRTRTPRFITSSVSLRQRRVIEQLWTRATITLSISSGPLGDVTLDAL